MPPLLSASTATMLRLPSERSVWNCQKDVCDDISLTSESWNASANTPVSNSSSRDETEPLPPPPIKVDFLSRFFAPKAGIDEDPVTGSAHCALAPYFCAKLGRTKVVGKQMSRRGGIVECEMVEEDASCVKLTGTAVTTMSGTLWIPGR